MDNRGDLLDPEDIFADVTQHPYRSVYDRIETPIRHISMRLFVIATLVIFAIFGMRSYSLSVNQSASLTETGTNAKERVFLLSPHRGAIFDVNGVVLVQNEPKFVAIYDPLAARALDEAQVAESITLFANVRGIPSSEIAAAIVAHGNRSDPLILDDAVPQHLAVELTSLLSGDVVRIETSARRIYTDAASSLAMVLGYVGAVNETELENYVGYGPNDAIGKSGVERSYESTLRGTAGERRVLVNAQGIAQGSAEETDPNPGQSIQLTIDFNLNEATRTALQRGLRRSGADGGAAVLLDPRSGAIRALVSLPDFDSQDLSDGLGVEAYANLLADPHNPFLNRAVSGQYPAGSTLKPFVGAAALEEEIVTPWQRLDASLGYITVNSIYDPEISWTFPDWKAHGFVNIFEALARSSNVYFYTVGGGYKNVAGLGVDRLGAYLNSFGFGDLTRIDLPNEAPGRIPTPAWKEETLSEGWYIGDTYNMSIGQGNVSVTPLQLAVATAAIANGGDVYKPYVVQDIFLQDNMATTGVEPEILHDLPISSENVDYIRQGMRTAVTAAYGTNRALGGLPIKVAAKTGTAQFGVMGRTHALVTAFAPYTNPELAIAIVLEGGGSGTEATTVAREILEWYALQASQ